jgi:YfiH family protein
MGEAAATGRNAADAGEASLPPGWWRPRFSAPRVVALMTGRQGGVSQPPWDSFNLRDEVGDDAGDVALNRGRLAALLGAAPVRLEQVHGVAVADLDALACGAAGPRAVGRRPVADAAVATGPGRVCEVQVADCLPVLFADRAGRGVAAAHAGWRGLAGGVLEATLAALRARTGAEAAEIEVWLGPCIGPGAFEVGEDVLRGFGVTADAPGPRFVPRAGEGHPGKWWADLPALARERLQAQGVTAIGGNDGSAVWCTVTQVSRYFSFRRDRVTGRQAACILLRG